MDEGKDKDSGDMTALANEGEGNDVPSPVPDEDQDTDHLSPVTSYEPGTDHIEPVTSEGEMKYEGKGKGRTESFSHLPTTTQSDPNTAPSTRPTSQAQADSAISTAPTTRPASQVPANSATSTAPTTRPTSQAQADSATSTAPTTRPASQVPADSEPSVTESTSPIRTEQSESVAQDVSGSIDGRDDLGTVTGQGTPVATAGQGNSVATSAHDHSAPIAGMGHIESAAHDSSGPIDSQDDWGSVPSQEKIEDTLPNKNLQKIYDCGCMDVFDHTGKKRQQACDEHKLNPFRSVLPLPPKIPLNESTNRSMRSIYTPQANRYEESPTRPSPTVIRTKGRNFVKTSEDGPEFLDSFNSDPILEPTGPETEEDEEKPSWWSKGQQSNKKAPRRDSSPSRAQEPWQSPEGVNESPGTPPQFREGASESQGIPLQDPVVQDSETKQRLRQSPQGASESQGTSPQNLDVQEGQDPGSQQPTEPTSESQEASPQKLGVQEGQDPGSQQPTEPASESQEASPQNLNVQEGQAQRGESSGGDEGGGVSLKDGNRPLKFVKDEEPTGTTSGPAVNKDPPPLKSILKKTVGTEAERRQAEEPAGTTNGPAVKTEPPPLEPILKKTVGTEAELRQAEESAGTASGPAVKEDPPPLKSILKKTVGTKAELRQAEEARQARLRSGQDNGEEDSLRRKIRRRLEAGKHPVRRKQRGLWGALLNTHGYPLGEWGANLDANLDDNSVRPEGAGESSDDRRMKCPWKCVVM